MTDTPMTPDREQEIRTLDLLELVSDRVGAVIGGHLAVLLGEVDRLRTALSDASDQVAGRDDEIGSLSARLHHLDRNALPELRREIESHKEGKARWRRRAEEAEARLHDAAMARVWTNEDGKKFVFADDLKGPLLGTPPAEGEQAPLRGRDRLNAKTVADAEATHWKRLGIDAPEAAEQAESLSVLDAMRAQHPAPCRVPDSPDCTCPDEGAYRSRVLPSRAATYTCGHSGADHHHAGTKCWGNLPRNIQQNGTWSATRICACSEFVAAQ